MKSSPVKSLAANPPGFMLRCEMEFTALCGRPSNQRRINGFKLTCRHPGRPGFDGVGPIPDKEPVSTRRLLSGARNGSGFSTMPRYFFNTRIGDQLISDPEGEVLRNPDRAWEFARTMIRELLATEGAGSGLLNAILEVTDDEGEIVLEFPFTEAILDLSDAPATKH
jgi:hypothetical protein